jgi:hypothetical protein
MGLTSWKGGAVRKADVTVAKNYLNSGEIGELNRIVTMWLDFAEDQARRRKQVFLRDWESKLDDFLRFNSAPSSVAKAMSPKRMPTVAPKRSMRSSPHAAASCSKRRASATR